MAANYGAHEMMEMHEVLTGTINGINQFHLYRPHVRDQQLLQMMDHQLQFLFNEYNTAVQMMQQHGAGQAIPYRAPRQTAPVYGLDNPAAQSPNTMAEQMDDRDVSSGILCFHKTAAASKIKAALECADPNLRRFMQQSAINCSEMAYEVWQYMNEHGYYQVPTMKDMTTNTVMHSYQQTNSMNTGQPLNVQ